jgi:urease accessory protein
MKSMTPARFIPILAAALAFPAVAHAHTGSSLVYDCASGIAHPFHGWDHLAAMFAIGVWAAQLGGRARWWVPAAFITVMTCAALVGSRGVVLPGVESMIATSVVALGILIAAAARMPIAASVALAALFAAAHGFAHGAEIPANAATYSHVAGFVLATAALHTVGLGIGAVALSRFQQIPRALGALCAVAGAALLFA